jgi:anaerobic magnesium-protoporphyrin IX monomethyl ester cyclase
MKVLCLNLPYPEPVVRRYTCSYYAPNFLLPPLELSYIAACIRQHPNCNVVLWDAIAMGWSVDEVLAQILQSGIHVVVALFGLETFEQDIATVQAIKRQQPALKIVGCGFWPTQFPDDILGHSPEIDYLVIGEPEQATAQLCSALASGVERPERCPVVQRTTIERRPPAQQRILSLDDLPLPARDLTPFDRYFEFFCPRPFTTMLTARGCASGCSFCIPTYGRRVHARTRDSILAELETLVEQQGVRMVRFMDDDFCYDRQRTADLCQALRQKSYRLSWSCLTRPDRLDEELVRLMQAAGCKRVYLGIETFSPKLQERLQKVLDHDRCVKTLTVLKNSGMEISCFFLLTPWHSAEDFQTDVELACALPLDYIVVSQLKIYPGTALYHEYQDDISFQLFPYRHHLKDRLKERQLLQWEKEFYRRFYTRIGFIRRAGAQAFCYPRDMWQGVVRFLNYLGRGRKGSNGQELFAVK